MPASARYGSLPFKEAISFFQNKLNMPSERWLDVWRDGHNSGFMVAGALKDDLLNDFRKAVDSAIAEGKSIGWFKKEFKTIVAKHGWSHTGEANWRAKVIYDTNMRQSYNAGRFEQLQHFEFWEYQHGDSMHPRPMHLSWHGTVLPKAHDFWQTHFPQNGWGCKCKVRGRTANQLERQGKKVKLPPKAEITEWTDKATGEVHKIPKGIDPGFDYAPQKIVVKQQQKKLSVEKAKPFEPPQRIAPTAFSTVKGADVHSLNTKLTDFKTAKPQFEQLNQFLVKHDVKTLLIKQSEMGFANKASKNLLPQVMGYLKVGGYSRAYYTINNAKRCNGFTSKSFSHVVVKVKSTTQFTKVKTNELINAVEGAILQKQAGKTEWSLSHIVRTYADSAEHGGAIVTWLHELGHQVHFKAGSKSPPVSLSHSISRYGSTNSYEWHAEHFAAWLLNREALAQWDNTVAEYFDKLMAGVL
ncbi:hypothetical protein A9Q81_20755 [Gammaproteobacteria bacterium 42_54_T18]|nr:hypothetical protein A9Q81_20755 [Gammaproteobacteria bacterium 42_54_T18]